MKHDDTHWLQRTQELAAQCHPIATAFCVGAVIVDAKGNEITSAYSRDLDTHLHAEESTIKKAVSQKKSLRGSTLYSSMEPCGERKSGNKSCVTWIIESGITKVVFAAYEPDTFVTPQGAALLQKAGIEIEYSPLD